MVPVRENAAVIVVTTSGQIAVQVRDNDPRIAEPGQLMVFAGRLRPGELPEAGARRELEEETTLRPDRLEFFTVFQAYPDRHGWAGFVHVYICRDIDPAQITILEGQGYRLLGSEADLKAPDCSVITRDILRPFFQQETAAQQSRDTALPV